MSEKPLGAQISHMLKGRGVEVIFGIPGVHNQEMYRGIEEAGLMHVLARHEQGAGFMADGYARATGLPGVCYVITGPGLCNAMTPMGQAYSDSVPVLVLSSSLDETEARKGQLHQMRDQEAAAATVCDWSATARTADAAYHLIDRALTEFEVSRPRPKHITVPIPLLEANAPAAPSAGELADLPLAVEQDVIFVVEALSAARRPLLIVGGGCTEAEFGARQLAERFGCAVLCTYAGRGVIAEDHPYHFGSSLARPSSVEEIKKADLVLAVGTELSEVDLWRDALGHDAPLIRVDIDPVSLTSERMTQKMVLSDAGYFFDAVSMQSERSEIEVSPKDWTVDEVQAARQRWRSEISMERPGIIEVADALKAILPEDTMIFSDMTQFAYGAKEVYPMDRSGHWHHPYGFGTLGYALPAAIGGKIGVGDQPVVAIAGDYGFQYTLQELMVAVELELCLPIIIWDNGKLGEIEDSMVGAQIAPNAVVQKNPDFMKLAEAYGAAAVAPQTLEALQTALSDALSEPRPTIIRLTPEIVTNS